MGVSVADLWYFYMLFCTYQKKINVYISLVKNKAFAGVHFVHYIFCLLSHGSFRPLAAHC